MTTHLEVGRRVRQAREERGLSQTALGRLLTPPRTHVAISDIERGKTKLDAEELTIFARLLDKSVAYFVESEPAPSVVYRRGERGLSSDWQRQTDGAIEAFKQYARQKAREQSGQERR